MLQLHFSAHKSPNAQIGLARFYTTSSPRRDQSEARPFWRRKCCYAIAAKRAWHVRPSELMGTALFGGISVLFLFCFCLFVLLFDDTPSVFGYAVYSRVSRYGFGENIMCQLSCSSPPRQRKCFYAIAGTAYRLTRGTAPATMLLRYRIWPFFVGVR